MPHDVTMPQLGMAQDAGRIVSWLKAQGDRVAKGDTLFEVETDKATMEVEAHAEGYLTHVRAVEGEEVPVGHVIARISDRPDDDAPGPVADAADGRDSPDGDLPNGVPLAMPQLGMSQDNGILVRWYKSPGDAIAADNVLFEVETDKSTVEVPAGRDGYLAATLAEAGEEVAVGAAVAIISIEKPARPLARSISAGKSAPASTPGHAAEPAPAAAPAGKAAPSRAPIIAPVRDGRILASPKARRLALDQGLDLGRLAETGQPQPYHVRDLEVLRNLPADAPQEAASKLRLVAETTADGFADFAFWAAEAHGLQESDALLAGLAGASLPGARPMVVSVERFSTSRFYAVPEDRMLSTVVASDGLPDLILRDLRGTTMRHVHLGTESAPIVTLLANGAGLSITLECGRAHLQAPDAIAFLTEFAGRMEQPLRHLL